MVARPDQTALHETLVDRRSRLNAHDAAVHRQRDPWGVSVFQIQSELIGLTDRHGGGAETQVRLRGSELTALDAARMRTLRTELFEFASLGGLTHARADSLWVGAHVGSPEQAESALDAAIRLDAHTVPETSRALSYLLQQTGLRTPSSVGEWESLFAMLDRAGVVLSRLRPEVFAAALADLASATGSRAWRNEHPVGPDVGWSARRHLRAEARKLWVGAGKPSMQELHAALLDADQLRLEWAAHSVDGGPPRLPAGLAEIRTQFGQFDRELTNLDAYLAAGKLAALPLADIQRAVSSLARDERTLRMVPRLNELAAGFARAGLSPS